MKHDAKWFFNFFSSKNNWCSGSRHEEGSYCAIGHVQKQEGYTDVELMQHDLTYRTDLVMELANEVFYGVMNDIWQVNDEGDTPKNNILKACRRAIKRQDPNCQLGKEFDVQDTSQGF